MIRVENLSYAYASTSHPALEGLSFAVKEGEILKFLSPSGVGKSTTQKVLIGLLRDYQGSAQVMGRELSAWGGGLLRASWGVF